MVGGRCTAAMMLGALLVLAVLGIGAAAASLPECTTDSQESPPFIITSAPCGTYGIVTTRRESVGGVETDISVQFMTHSPSGPRRPKGLVVAPVSRPAFPGTGARARDSSISSRTSGFRL